MNERGVSIFRLIGVVFVIGVMLTVVFPGVSSFLDKGLGTYISYEDQMEGAAVVAVKNCVGSGSFDCVNPSRGEENDISLDYLLKKGYIKEFNAPNGETCDLEKSHVHVIGNGNLNYTYKVCLYCKNYKTEDSYCIYE